jgi:AmmeMemoRadiSam system protein B
MTDRPKLRPVEVIEAQASGRRMYVVRDASRLTDGAVTVSDDVLYVMQFLDGRHSPLDIRTEYMRKFGSFLFENQLDELLRKLDDTLLLEGETFDEHMRSLSRDFAALESRPAAHSGAAYPSDPEELCDMLDGFFEGDGGPGALPSADGDGPAPRGLVLPHIDIRAGGRCLAWGYRELAAGKTPGLFVILGTGHSGPQYNFAVTAKDFVTPLGRARTDKTFVSNLLEGCSTDFTAGELAHRSEHSVEFHVLFLQHLYRALGRGDEGPTIVPVLCSFSSAEIGPGADAETAGRVVEFVSALRSATERSGVEVCLLASADLAHLGPRYGDASGIGPGGTDRVRGEDLELLAAVEGGDADGFASLLRLQGDRRRICGFSSIYTLLKALEPASARLLKHGCAPVDDRGSVVSFASLAVD